MTRRDEFADAIAGQLYNRPHDTDSIKELLGFWLRNVPAEVFKPSGKWAYSVELDYRNGTDNYVTPGHNALRALRQATDNGTSGVVFGELAEGWVMFVPAPPEGFPVMVVGGAA